jgi:hypothetical protein
LLLTPRGPNFQEWANKAPPTAIPAAITHICRQHRQRRLRRRKAPSFLPSRRSLARTALPPSGVTGLSRYYAPVLIAPLSIPNSSRRRRSNFFWKSRAGNHPHRSFKNFGTLRARVLLAKVPIALKRAVGLSGPSSSRQSAPILQQWSEQVCNLFVCNSIRGVAHNTVV